ncbi:MAG: hypothetical protein AAF968_06795 [Pseudomonadota bacterium]
MEDTKRRIDPLKLSQLIGEDSTGEIRDQAVAEIGELAAHLEQKIKAGVAPAEFERLTKVRAGLLAASSVVTMCWTGYHRPTAG